MMKRLAGFLIGIALGVGLAMLVGWVLFPMHRQAVTPASFREDYRTEYLRLVAISYGADGDLGLAQKRLQSLGGDPYTAPLIDVTEQWIAEGRSEDLIVPFARLALALGVDTPDMAPYLAGGGG